MGQCNQHDSSSALKVPTLSKNKNHPELDQLILTSISSITIVLKLATIPMQMVNMNLFMTAGGRLQLHTLFTSDRLYIRLLHNTKT